MLDVYSEWLESFIGKEPEIKDYDGTHIRDRFRNLNNAYAYYDAGSKNFGYNSTLMNDMDEAIIIAIAAHEAGHYWTMKIENDWPIFLGLLYSCIGVVVGAAWISSGVPIPIFFIQFWLSVISFVLSMLSTQVSGQDNEYNADDFVRNTLGPAMSLNDKVNLLYNPTTEKMSIGNYDIDQIKASLKELEIDYEDNEE